MDRVGELQPLLNPNPVIKAYERLLHQYGGKFGPAFTALFLQQNERIADGSISDKSAYLIHLDTLGIVNGCIDSLYQVQSYAEMAYNNVCLLSICITKMDVLCNVDISKTYGIRAFNQSHYHWAVEYFHTHCRQEIIKCQTIAAEKDPNEIGDNDLVNRVCTAAEECGHKLIGDYGEDVSNYRYRPDMFHLQSDFLQGQHSWFDIAHPALDPFPPPHIYGFLNQQWVQGALGVPINFTAAALNVALNFRSTGDPACGGLLEDIEFVLDRGVKVALVYGDRDFACSWIGGERVSLAIPYASKANFEAAGYEPIQSE